jgi:integrase
MCPRSWRCLRDRDSLSARALEFTVLTAARTGEVIGARWGEFDLKAKVWTIPAERMKARLEHRVPLSDRAVEIIKGIERSGALVFPLSNMAMLELLRGTAGNGYVVHGFRSAFRDWAGESSTYPRDVIEFALAHKLPDKVEAAYRRETAVEKRRKLMQSWANYCAKPAADNVTHLRVAR